MKILVVCQHYYPEPFRITDICEELVKLGHQVTVVTGLPNYPEGKIYDGYKSKERRNETINGVNVHRCFTIARREGAFWRLLNYFSFSWSSKRFVKKLDKDYDIVFINQLSPVMMANAGLKYKKSNNIKAVLYCLDLWPESLVVGGIKKKSLIYNLFHKLSGRIYKSCDKIVATSKSFSSYFAGEFGIEDVEYLPQFSESIFSPDACKKVRNESIDLMFAGNVGTAQSINTIVKAAKITENISNLHWHIVGDGTELESAKILSKELGINSITFHGRKPLEEMPRYYSMADAMLVTMQKDDIISLTLPGKIQTYMAAGKAIIGAIDGEARAVIKEASCGLCCNAEDAEGLAECVKKFISQNDIESYEKNAHKYYLENYSKETFFNKLEELLYSYSK